MNEAPVLEARGLVCGYGDGPVLKGIDFRLGAGDFVGVLGPNGCGKSTLIRAMSGVLRAEKGEVTLSGRPISAMPRREVARQIAVIPQDRAALFAFTVLEVVLMGRTPHIGRFEAVRPRDLEVAGWALERTDALHLKDRLITTLSGGERQRVVVARALAQEPRILLLDEPTSFLDLNHQVEIFDLLDELSREHGLTLLCASHDLNVTAEYCDRLVMLQAGRIVAEGTPEEIVTADHIREVYGAEVIVRESPATGAPQVTLVPRAKSRSRLREASDGA